MNIQPLDLPALLGAVTWPLVAVVAFTVFRRPLSEVVGVLDQRARKFSFGGASLQLAELPEMKPPEFRHFLCSIVRSFVS